MVWRKYARFCYKTVWGNLQNGNEETLRFFLIWEYSFFLKITSFKNAMKIPGKCHKKIKKKSSRLHEKTSLSGPWRSIQGVLDQIIFIFRWMKISKFPKNKRETKKLSDLYLIWVSWFSQKIIIFKSFQKIFYIELFALKYLSFSFRNIQKSFFFERVIFDHFPTFPLKYLLRNLSNFFTWLFNFQTHIYLFWRPLHYRYRCARYFMMFHDKTMNIFETLRFKRSPQDRHYSSTFKRLYCYRSFLT